MTTINRDSTSARRAKGVAALQELLSNKKVFHKIDPDELQEKASRMAERSAWREMRAASAAWQVGPSRPRPACPTSTRLALTRLTYRPFTPIINSEQSRDLSRSTLMELAHP
jgi:hypothetical protein